MTSSMKTRAMTLREEHFNDYSPEQVLPAHVTPRKIPALISSHASTDPGSLGVKVGGPKNVIIDLTSDSREKRDLANNYEEDLMTQLDRVLCLQLAQAEKNLAKSSTLPESMLSRKTQKRIANMDKEDKKFEEKQQKAKTKKQKATLGRFQINLTRMRENLDKKVKAELLQIQTKAGAPRVTQPKTTQPVACTASGRRGLRPVLPTRQHAPSGQELLVNDRFGEQKALPKFQSMTTLTSQQDLKELWQQQRSEQPPRIVARKSNLGKRNPRKQICRAAAADPASLPSDPNQPRARAQIESAESIIGYVFTDKNIIFEALLDYTSGVAKIENRAIPDANMHLALVGDSILTSVLREDGYYKERSRLSISRDVPPIVTNQNLAGVCKSMQLDYCIYLGESEKPKAHEPNKRLADLVEALVGAVYLDGGLETVKLVMRKMGLLSS
ncbi:ribonuclease III [Venturia nashicola]|uniref:Ribonuclease III n=1 Tax=Venturia nashicola TaxID=86259 RepID=A0A4Z1P884_9PEZI|nr:ribonuclease III [Venturia nashicola]